MSVTDDIKNLLDQQAQAFENFKKENDKRLAEIAKTGAASATTVENVEKLNGELTKIGNQLKAANERSDALEARLNRMGLGGGGNPGASDAEQAFAKNLEVFNALTGAERTAEDYRNYGRAFNAYLRKGDQSISADFRNDLMAGSNPDGGYWVTPDKTGRMVAKIYQTSPMRQVASVQTIGTDALEGPIDNGQASIGGWVGETETRTSGTGTPQVGVWRIPANEMYAEPITTQKVLDDAQYDVEGWLSNKVADVFVRTENTAFITGDGVRKPRGILSYTAVSTSDATRAWGQVQYVPTGASGAFNSTAGADVLLDAVYALKTQYRVGASWLSNSSTIAALRKLKDGMGNYLWAPGSASQPATLHGYAVNTFEDMPVIAANSLSVGFGNWTESYQIVDRQGIRVLRDPLTKKGFVKFYTVKRTGGDVLNFEAYKLIKFAAS